ncbi:MAG: GNAT family N-acetyltransferase [Lachnospirales bacterium]
MKAQNSSQWQEGYPNLASIEEDLDNRQGWVLLKDGQVAAYMAATDFDPNYEVPIWAGGAPYWALHRFAIKKDFRGQGLIQLLLKKVIAFGQENESELPPGYGQAEPGRPAPGCKLGFVYRGIITVTNDSVHRERRAYELLFDK